MAANPQNELARLYKSVTSQITRTLQEAKRRGVTPPNKGYLLGQLRELATQMQQLDAQTAKWVEKNVAQEYIKSAGQAQRTLTSLPQPAGAEIQSGFTGVEQRAMRALELRITRDLRQVREAIALGLSLGDPSRGGFRAVRAALDREGLVQLDPDRGAVIRVPSGRLWKADTYAKMLSRTAVADARRVAFRERYLANGIDVVRVVANGTEHDLCAAWEGRLLSLTGETPGIPTVEEARAAGLFHPQCRHRYVVATGPDVPQPPVPRRSPPSVPVPEPVRPTLGREAPQIRRPIPLRPRRRPATRRTPRTPAPAPRPQPVLAPARTLDVIDRDLLLDRRAEAFLQVPPGTARTSKANLVSQATRETVFDRMVAKAQASNEASEGGFQTKNRLVRQRDAIREYTGAGYGSINEALRLGGEQLRRARTVRRGGMKRSLGDTIDEIDGAFTEHARSYGREAPLLWRQVGREHAARLRANVRVGDTISDPGFQSWTAVRQVSHTFGTGGSQAPILFRYQMPGTQRGVWIGGLEAEMLLNRGTKFRVAKIEKNVVVQKAGPLEGNTITLPEVKREVWTLEPVED